MRGRARGRRHARRPARPAGARRPGSARLGAAARAARSGRRCVAWAGRSLRLRAQAAIAEAGGAVAAGAFDAATRCGALQAAAGAGRPDVLEALLAAGAPVDAPDGNGLTALQARGAGGARAPGLLSQSWSLSTFVRPPVCGWQARGVLRAAPRGLAPLHPDHAAAEPGALALLAALVTRARAPAASVQACHREGTHAAHRAGPTPGRCARAQVARRYEQCDAEGVLLRAGARDPEGDAPAAPAAGGRGRGRARGSGAPRRHPAAREARGVREAAAGAGDGARAEPGGAAPPPAVQASLAALGKDCSAAGAPPLVLPCPCMLLPLAVPCSTTIGCTVCLPLLQPAAAVGRAGKS